MFLAKPFLHTFFKFYFLFKNSFLIDLIGNPKSTILNLFTTTSYFILSRCKNLRLVPSIVYTSNIGIVYDMDCGVADPGVWLFAYDLYYSISSVSVFVVLFVGFYLCIIYQSFKIKPITSYFNSAERILSGVNISSALNLSKSWQIAYKSHYNRYFDKWQYDSRCISLRVWFKQLTESRKNALSHKNNYFLTHGMFKDYSLWLETWAYRLFLLQGYYKKIEAKLYEKPALYIELAWTVLPTSIVSLIVIPSLSLIFFIHSGYLVFKLSWWRRYSYLASLKDFDVTDSTTEQMITTFNHQKLNSTITTPKLLNVIVEGNQWFWSYKIEPKDARSYLEFLRGYVHTPSYQNSTTSKDFFNFIENNLDDYLLEYDSYMVRDPELAFGDVRLLTTDVPLYLPNNAIINFHILSNDVIHSFAVPQFFIKADAIPGRITTVRFDTSYVFGLFYGQCSEICGVNHAFMPIAINIVESFYYNAKALINNNIIKTKHKFFDHYLGCSSYNSYERLRVGFDITNFYLKKITPKSIFTNNWSYILSDFWLEQYRVGSYRGRYSMAKNLIELAAASAVNSGLTPPEQLNAITNNLSLFMKPLPTRESIYLELIWAPYINAKFPLTDNPSTDLEMVPFLFKIRPLPRILDKKDWQTIKFFSESNKPYLLTNNVPTEPNNHVPFDMMTLITLITELKQTQTKFKNTSHLNGILKNK